MATPRNIDFGYSPPVGDRGFEKLDARTFVSDLQNALSIATEHFTSVWISDHLMSTSGLRMECWTELTWVAARFPTPMLGTVVLCNSFRNPALLAKMAASLQLFSRGRVILGYGAGWSDAEYAGYGYDFPSPGDRVRQMVEGI